MPKPPTFNLCVRVHVRACVSVWLQPNVPIDPGIIRAKKIWPTPPQGGLRRGLGGQKFKSGKCLSCPESQ